MLHMRFRVNLHSAIASDYKFYKLDIHKLVNGPGCNDLKTKANYVDVNKLKLAPLDLKKLSDAV